MSKRFRTSFSLALAGMAAAAFLPTAMAAEQTSGVPMNVAKRLDDRKEPSTGVAAVPKSDLTLREAKSNRAASTPAGTEGPTTKSTLSGIPMVQAKRL